MCHIKIVHTTMLKNEDIDIQVYLVGIPRLDTQLTWIEWPTNWFYYTRTSSAITNQTSDRGASYQFYSQPKPNSCAVQRLGYLQPAARIIKLLLSAFLSISFSIYTVHSSSSSHTKPSPSSFSQPWHRLLPQSRTLLPLYLRWYSLLSRAHSTQSIGSSYPLSISSLVCLRCCSIWCRALWKLQVELRNLLPVSQIGVVVQGQIELIVNENKATLSSLAWLRLVVMVIWCIWGATGNRLRLRTRSWIRRRTWNDCILGVGYFQGMKIHEFFYVLFHMSVAIESMVYYEWIVKFSTKAEHNQEVHYFPYPCLLSQLRYMDSVL